MNKMNEEKQVARLAEMLALECGLNPVTAKRLYVTAALHDIGKKLIPDNILNKQGELDVQEFEIMKTHTVIGAGMLSGVQGELGVMARNICLYHHESFNGSGYFGKYTDELPAYIPIVSVCDVLVALLNKRPYKQAWHQQEALDYIQNQAGTQFNPALVKTFISLIKKNSRVPAVFNGR